MARAINKLTLKQIRSLSNVGRHSDGGGLYLKVRKSGSKAWVFMHRKDGKVTELGLGAAKDVSIVDVREEASRLRKRAKAGLPLVEAIEIVQEIPTFLEVVEIVLKSKDPTWKNDKTRAQWHMTLKVYAKPIHSLKVTDIKTPHVLRILEPMWLNKHETASRLRGRIEAVLDYAKAMGWRSGENPAVWRGNLALLLPAYSKSKNLKHHAALAVEDLPNFMVNLRGREAVVARMLEFIILTAARLSEARLATWDEIDFNKRLWTLSAERMKMSKAHVVPLSDRSFELINNLHKSRQGNIIFSHPTNGRVFSINATRALMKRMTDEKLTTHGFRSTFRDWAGDRNLHQRETIEAALAHSIKDRAEAAYRRSTAIEKRRLLMQDWDNYCAGRAPSIEVLTSAVSPVYEMVTYSEKTS